MENAVVQRTEAQRKASSKSLEKAREARKKKLLDKRLQRMLDKIVELAKYLEGQKVELPEYIKETFNSFLQQKADETPLSELKDNLLRAYFAAFYKAGGADFLAEKMKEGSAMEGYRIIAGLLGKSVSTGGSMQGFTGVVFRIDGLEDDKTIEVGVKTGVIGGDGESEAL